MGKVKELWMKEIEDVIQKLDDYKIEKDEAYQELLRLGYNRDEAYEIVYV